ncbi:hypothetical protein FN846DRAFT_890722 [Sphaerosporella brunnea]|uniref:Secreted protein n=1 Tax=Sphaerosporella brunnea TaxID=1250544 RepID=A0A5J5EVK7_9PEZI|nr:hypothetical protein FN846DRAFT_890722 [Sphaerosporella brunnea]
MPSRCVSVTLVLLALIAQQQPSFDGPGCGCNHSLCRRRQLAIYPSVIKEWKAYTGSQTKSFRAGWLTGRVQCANGLRLGQQKAACSCGDSGTNAPRPPSTGKIEPATNSNAVVSIPKSQPTKHIRLTIKASNSNLEPSSNTYSQPSPHVPTTQPSTLPTNSGPLSSKFPPSTPLFSTAA